MTKEERKSCGIPSAKAFAAKHRLHESQLSRWTQRKDFNALRVERFQVKLAEFVPEAFEALRKRIRRFDIGRDVELWLAYCEGWTKKLAAQYGEKMHSPPPFTENDIRALIAYLPAEEQLQFRQMLAKLLLKAQEAQEKNEIN